MKLSVLIEKLKYLEKELKTQNSKSPKVLISSDEEGNSFGDIDPEVSFGYDKESNTLVFYPINIRYDI